MSGNSHAEKPGILLVGPYPAWDMDALERRFVLHHYYQAENKREFLARAATRVRGIATRGELGADAALIDALPGLEIIAVYGVGYDAVDLDAARRRGVRVTNTPDVLTGDVADLGFGMMLATARGMVGADAWVRSGAWAAEGMYPLQLQVHGKRVGILGLGRIGTAIAERCVAFDMPIAYHDPIAQAGDPTWSFVADPVQLAHQSDVLFVTCTGGTATRHLVDREVLEALGPKGMLVNVSRASSIDEAALLDALEQRTLGFAALDVFTGEPNLNPRFLHLDNVLLQPHHASGTVETRKAMGALVRENLEAHFAGRALLTPVI